MAYPKVDEETCVGCGACVSVCPADPVVFEMEDDKSKVVHPEACIECGSCVEACPVDAITLVEE